EDDAVLRGRRDLVGFLELPDRGFPALGIVPVRGALRGRGGRGLRRRARGPRSGDGEHRSKREQREATERVKRRVQHTRVVARTSPAVKGGSRVSGAARTSRRG